MRRAAIAVVVLLASACFINRDPPPSLPVPADPALVIDAARRVFRAYDIPVKLASRHGDPVIESERFRVDRYWGGEAIGRRIHCGTGENGTPRPPAGPVVLSIRVEVRRDAPVEAPVLTPSGAPIRTYVRSHGSIATLYSSGFVDAPGRGRDCRLSPGFAEELLGSIAYRAVGSRITTTP